MRVRVPVRVMVMVRGIWLVAVVPCCTTFNTTATATTNSNITVTATTNATTTCTADVCDIDGRRMVRRLQIGSRRAAEDGGGVLVGALVGCCHGCGCG